MQFTTEQQNGFVIVRFSGALVDAGAACTEYHGYIQERVREGCRTFILNFKDVQHLNSNGLGMLIASRTTMLDAGGKLILCNVEPISQVLRFTGLEGIFKDSTFPTEADALAACTVAK